ncbi:MAG: hypothetical protein Kow0029_31090 [Candidatus Rifleibacteriota bacterium]
MVRSHKMLKRNPSDYPSLEAFTKAEKRIQKKVFAEFRSGKFNVFSLVLKRIDKFEQDERMAFINLLKSFQDQLLFKVVNGDWYYARFYYQLKLFVEKWGLQKDIPFTTDASLLRSR